MQTSIQTFSFNSLPVRIEIKEGEPLFCLTDVAEILNIRNANPSRFNMSEDGVHLMYSVDSAGRKNEITFINEPNLYRVIFRSRKEEAVQFQNWVFEEVLPQIRKTGSYQIPYTAHPKDTLTLEQQNVIRNLVKSNVAKLPKEQQAGAIIKTWSKLKAHFKVPYRNIPQGDFLEAISIVQRTAADWELVNDAPTMDRLTHAYTLASEVAAVASRTVFDAVMNGDDDSLTSSPP